MNFGRYLSSNSNEKIPRDFFLKNRNSLLSIIYIELKYTYKLFIDKYIHIYVFIITNYLQYPIIFSFLKVIVEWLYNRSFSFVACDGPMFMDVSQQHPTGFLMELVPQGFRCLPLRHRVRRYIRRY